jgi:hypothetical protein
MEHDEMEWGDKGDGPAKADTHWAIDALAKAEAKAAKWEQEYNALAGSYDVLMGHYDKACAELDRLAPKGTQR